jgi:hypothetical protein
VLLGHALLGDEFADMHLSYEQNVSSHVIKQPQPGSSHYSVALAPHWSTKHPTSTQNRKKSQWSRRILHGRTFSMCERLSSTNPITRPRDKLPVSSRKPRLLRFVEDGRKSGQRSRTRVLKDLARTHGEEKRDSRPYSR